MSRTRTLLQLRDEIRNRGDLMVVRHTDVELTRNVNQSIAELYDLLVEVNKDYFLDYDDVSVVSGTGEYALDADFYKVLGVDVQDGSHWRQLRRFNWAERNQLQEGGAGKLTTRYRAMGSNLRLRPTPQWSGTLRLWFIPAYEVLVNPGDTFDGMAGWEEYVVIDCLIKARVKDEEDIQELMALKDAQIRRIRSEASERDDGEPNRIRDCSTEAAEAWPTYRSLGV